MESVDKRKKTLELWLSTFTDLQSFSLQPLPYHASFRRYFRVYTPSSSMIAMDAPPGHEDCLAYVVIADALRKIGLHTPEIFQKNIAEGFLLITDFGDLTYLKILNHNNADTLYKKALNALSILQSCGDVHDFDLPLFSREWMSQEWAWYKEWFVDKLLHLNLGAEEKKLDQCFDRLIDSALAQPQVFMHRDYHSDNLMHLHNDVGLLDFQSAFRGPITYDLVSLLRDCYIDWPEKNINNWVNYYWDKLQDYPSLGKTTQEEFLRWFDWMGIERHLKALFTFARKQVRDQQSDYLKPIPRVLKYLSEVTKRYSEFAALHQYINITVKPKFEEMFLCMP